MNAGSVVVDIESPDTDVFLYNTTLTADHGHENLTVRFLKHNPAKIPGEAINLNTVCESMGQEKASGLIGVHIFTGSDWGGKFASISKKKWIKTYLELEPTSPIVEAFRQLGEVEDPLSLLAAIEEFVCKAYSKNTTCKEVSALRWEMFRNHNKVGEQLPPTRDTLIPHLKRSNVIAQIAKGYTVPHPEILPLIGNGWEEKSPGVVTAITCLSLPAPEAALILTKCSCTTPCGERYRCGCVNNGCFALVSASAQSAQTPGTHMAQTVIMTLTSK